MFSGPVKITLKHNKSEVNLIEKEALWLDVPADGEDINRVKIAQAQCNYTLVLCCRWEQSLCVLNGSAECVRMNGTALTKQLSCTRNNRNES